MFTCQRPVGPTLFWFLATLPHLLHAQTMVTLSATPNPSKFGAPVILNATVTPASATGQVTFFDGVAILGTKPASSGVASLSSVLLSAGTHNLTAYYRDGAGITGRSNVIAQAVEATAGGAFLSQTPLNATASSVALGDFNGDGKVDIAAVNGSNAVTVLSGKGDGTFQQPVNYAIGASAGSIAAGDFNGDGNTDLAVASSAGVGILLGNGDGTFRSAVNLAVFTNLHGFLSTTANTLAVADFNGDGKADLLIAYTAAYSVLAGGVEQPSSYDATVILTTTGFNLLPGNGDGTFGLPVGYSRGGYPDLVVADFDGAGEPDLAFVPGDNTPCGCLGIELGKGDGTAQYAGYVLPGALTVYTSYLIPGDFNGDGKTDLAVGGFAEGPPGTFVPTTWILLGKSDGTLQPAVSYPFGAAAASGDFNGDGITDLVVVNGSRYTTVILYGKGDGTFQQARAVSVSAGFPLAVADFNGDGKADLLTATPYAEGPVTVLLGATSVNAGPPASVAVTGGSPQFAPIGTAFPNALQVTVQDSNGVPVPGVTVTFTAPSLVFASAILSSLTVVTNASGAASVTAVANTIAGPYTVTASVGSLTAIFSLTNFVGGPTNLARGRTATQSSTLPGYATDGPGAAVDGNSDGNFNDGSVTATNQDPNAWWQVDLGAPASVSSVVIFNRTDCCASRLTDFWVFVSNTPFLPTDTPTTLQNRAGTYSSHQTMAPNPTTAIPFNGAQGQYVRVQLTGTDYLSLAEVQVIGTGSNLANLSQGRLATQSSTFPGYAADGAAAAVDGNRGGNFGEGSVTATNADPNAWWQVDLGGAAAVSSIVIWNRTDCCGSRLNDYWVFVSDTPFLPTDTPTTLQNRAGTFASHQTSAPNPSAVITFASLVTVSGRYVRVQLSGTDYLSLAEVQVFGTGGAPAPTDVALGKAATQSSTFPGYATDGAAAAVDGNTDGNFGDGSVTATNLDSEAWWQVDLGASTAVSSIVIWNRTDCCSIRLGDYWVFVSDTPFLATDTSTTLSSRPGTFASHQTSIPNPSTTITAAAQGRYVRVQLNNADNLSLAEVQVFGH